MPYVGVRTILGRQGIGLPAPRPIHAATGAPSNFSGLLDYVVGAGGCGVDIVGLSVDGT